MWRWVLVLLLCISVSGCAVNIYSGRPSDKAKIGKLSQEVTRLEELREKERQELESAMRDLEHSLRKEIDNKDVSLQMLERGLVITFLAEVLFDSGKAVIKDDAKPVLKKVGDVIIRRAGTRNVGVEGHTDNEPIKYSGWKSNWELSTARATSVLHFLIDDAGLRPERLSAIGYGEFRPIESNSTEVGRQKNRRVEIVIIPEISKQRDLPKSANRSNIK
ncbi:MAG: OmpA family protein [Candidatus Omnitrophota bacterium]